MTTIRPFKCEDMFRFNKMNLDSLTETYGLSFYLQYLAHWPEYFQVKHTCFNIRLDVDGECHILNTKKIDHIMFIHFYLPLHNSASNITLISYH